MNIIEQIQSIRKNGSNLLDVLNVIRAILNNADNNITLKGKTLRGANVEQPTWHAYYDEIRVHLNSVSDYFKIKILEQRAKVLRMISEQSHIAYGETMMTKLAEEDPIYINFQYSKLEVDEVLALAKSKCDAMKERGYALKNITELVVAQSQDEHLILN